MILKEKKKIIAEKKDKICREKGKHIEAGTPQRITGASCKVPLVIFKCFIFFSRQQLDFIVYL